MFFQRFWNVFTFTHLRSVFLLVKVLICIWGYFCGMMTRQYYWAQWLSTFLKEKKIKYVFNCKKSMAARTKCMREETSGFQAKANCKVMGRRGVALPNGLLCWPFTLHLTTVSNMGIHSAPFSLIKGVGMWPSVWTTCLSDQYTCWY